MKAWNTIMKLLAAMAAVAGAIYVVATYGDKIVAWAKALWEKLPHAEVTVEIKPDTQAQAEEAPVEEAPAEEAPVEEAPAPVEAAPEIPENEPIAEESDFAE